MNAFTKATRLLLLAFVGAAIALTGCDSAGSGGEDPTSGSEDGGSGTDPTEEMETLSYQKLTGNWQRVPAQRDEDFDPVTEPLWYRIVPQTTFFSESQADRLNGQAFLYVIEGDCDVTITGVGDMRSDGFEIVDLSAESPAPSVFSASISGDVLTLDKTEGPDGAPLKFERIDQNAFRVANNDHPVDGLSCDFPSPDSANPRK